LLACTVVGSDGRLLRFGRPLVKNVAGYDLPRLACGSRGRLGAIRDATLRLWPLPAERRLLAVRSGGRDEELTSELATLARELAALAPAAYTEPELVCWEADTASGSSRLLVGLHGSRASVEARHGELAEWAGAHGARIQLLERYDPVSTDPQRRVRLVCPRRSFSSAAQTARRLLDREGVSAVRLSGYPLSGTLICSYQVDGDTDSVELTRMLARECGAEAVCVELGSAADNAGVEESRSVAVVELESRVLAALGVRPRGGSGTIL
jgi:FAD/FMN-containing dehydrogenase